MAEKIKSWAVALFNAIREKMTPQFKENIPQMTNENIAEIGQLFKNTYSLEFNEFNAYLWTRVGATYVWQRAFENPLDYKKGGDDQRDIVDVFTHMFRKGRQYDPQGRNALNRTRQTPTEVITHRQNTKWTWPLTIDRVNFLNAFNTASELEDYLAGQFTSMYNSPKYCDYLVSLTMLTPYAPNGVLTLDTDRMLSQIDLSASTKDGLDEDRKPVASLVANARDNMVVQLIGGVSKAEAMTFTTEQKIERVIRPFARMLKKTLEKIKYPHREYNASGVENLSKKDKLTLFISSEVSAYLDVDFYATLFGANYAQTQDLEIKVIDEFIVPQTTVSGNKAIVTKENSITDCANPLDCAISQVGDENGTLYFAPAYNIDDLFNGVDPETSDNFIIPLGTLCDEDYMRSFLNEYNVYPQPNADGDFINYFTHVRSTYSFAPFNNCVNFALGVADFFAEGETPANKDNITIVVDQVSIAENITSASIDGEIAPIITLDTGGKVASGYTNKFFGVNYSAQTSLSLQISKAPNVRVYNKYLTLTEAGEIIVEINNSTGNVIIYLNSTEISNETSTDLVGIFDDKFVFYIR